MRRSVLPCLLLATALSAACRNASAPRSPAEGGPALSDLVVLYAGDGKGERTRSFRDFLARHAKAVRVMDVQDLGTASPGGADVLIVDGTTVTRDEQGIRIVPGPSGVSLESLAIPTVLVGGMGGQVSDALELKLGWRYG